MEQEEKKNFTEEKERIDLENYTRVNATAVILMNTSYIMRALNNLEELENADKESIERIKNNLSVIVEECGKIVSNVCENNSSADEIAEMVSRKIQTLMEKRKCNA